MGNGFTIPDLDEAAWGPQSHIFELDFKILVWGLLGRTVVSGCDVTEQGTPDMTVAVAAGVIELETGARVAVTGGNLTVTAAHATLWRQDLISVSAAGVKTITAGTAAAVEPIDALKPPDLPSGHVALAVVTIPPTASAISVDEIIDKRPLASANFLRNALGGLERVVDVAVVAGAADLPLAEGNWFRIDLDASADVTIDGLTANAGCSGIVEVIQDVTGGHALNWTNGTFRAGASDQPDQAANSHTFFVFWSSAGDSEINVAPVGGGDVVLSDDTPAAAAGAGDAGVSTEVSRSDHAHPAGGGATPTDGSLTATVATDEATASTSYTDLATAGPAVTLTVNTMVLVIVQCRSYSSSTGWYSRMGFAVSGANTLAASDVRACGLGGAVFDGISSRSVLLTGLTPGSTTFTAKYEAPAGTPHFMNRDITVIPLD